MTADFLLDAFGGRHFAAAAALCTLAMMLVRAILTKGAIASFWLSKDSSDNFLIPVAITPYVKAGKVLPRWDAPISTQEKLGLPLVRNAFGRPGSMYAPDAFNRVLEWAADAGDDEDEVDDHSV
mmetsp:Transcript_10761/g.24568  ORF Transcript_10761/g.24568 Transcript_10761/m.24568 type:complete len:124 (+) Transcript_10761:113-484(+)